MSPPPGYRPTRHAPLTRTLGPWQLELGSPSEPRTLSLSHGHRLVVGSGRDADVQVDDEAVSSRHLELIAGDDGLAIRDLHSANGTFVGPAKIRQAVLTGTGGTIVIGRTTLSAQVAERAVEEPRPREVPGLIGSTFVMRRLAADIVRYAALRASVLIFGETGSGKEVVARALHELSGRKGAFVAVNVGGLSEALADSELFGHARGAFTGAFSARTGAFQQAADGTIFLDEIADLAPSLQIKLLRVIEERALRPLGSGTTVPLSARVVSACWAPIDEQQGSKAFRNDLYHRIATIVLRIPPLRERKADIAALTRALLDRHAAEFGPKEASPRALALLVDHDWPGNVRELGAVLYRAAALSPGRSIDVAHVQMAMAGGRRPVISMQPEEAVRYLEKHGHNVSRAARSLGVPRSTFRSWLSKARGPVGQAERSRAAGQCDAFPGASRAEGFASSGVEPRGTVELPLREAEGLE